MPRLCMGLVGSAVARLLETATEALAPAPAIGRTWVSEGPSIHSIGRILPTFFCFLFGSLVLWQAVIRI